jgi:hypothetical protein
VAERSQPRDKRVVRGQTSAADTLGKLASHQREPVMVQPRFVSPMRRRTLPRPSESASIR